MAQIGLITEQGDLGLGFDSLNENDQKIYEESTNTDSNENQAVINEGKDK